MAANNIVFLTEESNYKIIVDKCTSLHTAEAVRYFNNLLLNSMVEKEMDEQYKDVLEPTKIPCWIAGGCLRDYFSGKQFSEIDLYVANEPSFLEASIALSDSGYNNVYHEADYSEFKHRTTGLTVVLRREAANIYDCISNFDFTISSVALDRTGIYYNQNFFKHLSSKRIELLNVIAGSEKETMIRLLEHQAKGFTIPDKTVERLFNSIKK